VVVGLRIDPRLLTGKQLLVFNPVLSCHFMMPTWQCWRMHALHGWRNQRH